MKLVQTPNPPLITALAAALIGSVTFGETKGFFMALFYAAIFIWAYNEVTAGTNNLRRVMGLIILVLVLLSLTKTLS